MSQGPPDRGRWACFQGKEGARWHSPRFPPSLIHSSDSLVPGGGSQGHAEDRRERRRPGLGAVGRLGLCGGGGPGGAGRGASTGRPGGGARLPSPEVSGWRRAGVAGSERLGAESVSARRPPGPQPRLLRLCRTRPPPGSAAAARCGRPARRARHRLAPAAAARPVGQSVSHGRAARELRALAASSREGAPRLRRRRRRPLPSPGPIPEPCPPEDRAVAAVSAQPRPRERPRSWRGAGLGSAAVAPPPFSRLPAPPSGRGAGGRAWGGVGAGAGGTSPGRWVGVGEGPGCTLRPGAATGDNEMQGRLGRVRLCFSGRLRGWWPGTAGRQGLFLPRISRKKPVIRCLGFLRVSVPHIVNGSVQRLRKAGHLPCFLSN